MSVFYATYQNIGDFSGFVYTLAMNLLGNYHVWFILLIFQFYILYHLFIKFKKDIISPKKVIALAFIVNILYLAFFNLTEPFSKSSFLLSFWDRGYWVPFIGWIFYFVLAYYSGRNYQYFLSLLNKYHYWIYIGLALSLILVLFNNQFEIFPYGSKRIDMIPFTTFMIMTLLITLRKLKKVNPLVKLISNYSFGIYLLHMFFISVVNKAIEIVGWNLSYFGIVPIFVFSIAASVIATYLIHKLPFGKYIVGSVNKSKSDIFKTKNELPPATSFN